MALAFKRSRLDMAHRNTYPNAKEEVIARTDVTNKNLLKNPFRTGNIAVGPVGVQNRPPNKMVDDRGAMYGGSVSVLRKDITNTNLLMNPYRFKTDPIDEPRTLTRQVIMDINSGKTPKYIRENKGIDEIAFMIVKALPDNGVKLATLSMLKSYITGMRLQSVLDQGGQNVVKAFDVLNQLVVTCTSLYKTGMLGMKLPGLLLQYSEDIAKVFNESVLQPVSPMLMFSAIQELASVSAVLTKLFRAQNSISTATNVSIDEWARQEAAKMQALRLQEAANTAPPVPVQQVAVAGDNQPTGTQGVKDADTIKQDGTGKKRKKKKLSEMMGGAELNWGIANPSNTQLTPSVSPSPPVKQPSLIQEPTNSVNTMPAQLTTWQKAKPIINDILEYGAKGLALTAAVYGAVRAVKDAVAVDSQRDLDNKKNIEREGYYSVGLDNWNQLTKRNKKFVDPLMAGVKIRTLALQRAGFNINEIKEIMEPATNLGKVEKLIEIMLYKQNQGWVLPPDQGVFDDDDDDDDDEDPSFRPGPGPPGPRGPRGGPQPRPPPGPRPPLIVAAMASQAAADLGQNVAGALAQQAVAEIPDSAAQQVLQQVLQQQQQQQVLPRREEKDEVELARRLKEVEMLNEFTINEYIESLEETLNIDPFNDVINSTLAVARMKKQEIQEKLVKEDVEKNSFTAEEKIDLEDAPLAILKMKKRMFMFKQYKLAYLNKLIRDEEERLKQERIAIDQGASGKKRRKTQKSKKITIKKSKNLDAQILALLRA